MKPNCENCVGEVRQQCDVIFENVRNYGGQVVFNAAENNANDDMIGIMNMTVQSSEMATTMVQDLKSLGCKLDEPSMRSGFIAEFLTGAELAAAELDEAEEAEDDAQTLRLEAIFKQIDESKKEWDAGAADRTARAREIEDVLRSSRKLSTETEAILDNFLADRLSPTREKIIQAYCQERQLDPDNLALADRLELKAHLRKLGFQQK